MKNKTKTIIVYALTVWFIMWIVTNVLYLLSIKALREWALLYAVVPLYLNIGFLSITLSCGWRYLKKKTTITIVWMMVLFFIATALYWLINRANYYNWNWVDY